MDYHLPHEAPNQEWFIYLAYKYAKAKKLSEWDLKPTEDVIHWLYKLGRDYNVLDMDYAEFKRVMLGQHKDYCYWNGIKYRVRYDRRKYYGSRSHYCRIEEYRVLKGFTHKGEPKKDNPSKDEWWEHKGFTRSRRRTSGFQRGWKRSLKYFNKRKHRQFERENIKNERYDKFHNRSWKIEDPWSWD